LIGNGSIDLPLRDAPLRRWPVDPSDLRIALFSGNYNYVRDGANQALNRLVAYLLDRGAKVRIYSPTVETPAFEPAGDLVSLPSVPIPGRREYRFPLGLPSKVWRDLAAFGPNMVQISSPDIAAHRAVSWARARNIPAVASIHTRFETYLGYYHLQLLEPVLRAGLRRLYRRCDALLAPAESTAAVLRAQRMNGNIHIWARGVDREQFNPGRRDMDWRRSLGIADDELAVAFLGRLVLEKGLDVFAASIAELRRRKVPHHPLVIGGGPARAWFEQQMPSGVFVGHQVGEDLARALATADVFLNPSITESFGNVTLESLASGVPVVAATATGTTNIVRNGETGVLVHPGDVAAFVEAIERYALDPALRRRHAEAGVAYASTQDWDDINASVLRVYENVIERRRSSSD
jgi:glycosyltransferase involved in cell wall biosynthesis